MEDINKCLLMPYRVPKTESEPISLLGSNMDDLNAAETLKSSPQHKRALRCLFGALERSTGGWAS